jgi:hemolysin activation/secretion protein
MATLGGNERLRGFKFDRFYGKSSFYQSSDVRWDIGTIRNSFFPINIGVFGGFDYGRVWLPGEISNIWHTSVGGGVALDVLEQIGLQTSYFHSKDGGRFVVGFGLNF